MHGVNPHSEIMEHSEYVFLLRAMVGFENVGLYLTISLLQQGFCFRI